MVGAVIMIIGGLVTIAYGVAAEGKSLEDIAAPLAAQNRPVPPEPKGAATPSA